MWPFNRGQTHRIESGRAGFHSFHGSVYRAEGGAAEREDRSASRYWRAFAWNRRRGHVRWTVSPVRLRIVSRTGVHRLPPQPLQPGAHRGSGRRPDRHRAVAVVVAGRTGGRRRAPVRAFQPPAAADLNDVAATAFLLVPPA